MLLAITDYNSEKVVGAFRKFTLIEGIASLLFNIFICNPLFTYCIDIVSYADDNITYAALLQTDLTIEKLEQCTEIFFTWFQNRGMKDNTDKCHFLSEY